MVKRDYYILILKYANIIYDALDRYKINDISELSNSMKNSIELSSIICLHLSQIGELSKKLPKSFMDEHKFINWSGLYRTRNIIAHDYDAISYGIVADMVYSQVLPLREVLIKAADRN